MSEVKIVLEKIIQLPKHFREENVSSIDLLKRFGYEYIHDEVNTGQIKEILRNNESVIREWFQWSENKRTSDGWYLIEASETVFKVGYWHKENGRMHEKTYSNAIDACAEFIRLEIDSISNPTSPC